MREHYQIKNQPKTESKFVTGLYAAATFAAFAAIGIIMAWRG